MPFIQSIWVKWIQKGQNWSIWPKTGLQANFGLKMGVVIFLKSTIAQSIKNVSTTTNLQLQASLEYILMKNLMENF